MKSIPVTQQALILRTDFSDQDAWKRIYALIQAPVGLFRFRASVDYLDDPVYSGLTKEQLLALIPKGYPHSFIIVADHQAITQPGFPLLVIDLYEGSGAEFRTLPAQVQSIENNLSIGNMDFEEFAGAVDEQGVFRGFPRR